MDRFPRALLTHAALLATVLVPLVDQGGHVGAEAPGAEAAPVAAGSWPAGAIHVVLDGAGLRVEVRGAQPAEVLQALGARSQVPVTVRGELPGRITRAFSASSLEDAVREVVRGYSAALVFARAGEGHGARVSEIRILARGNAPPAPAAREPDPPAPLGPAPRLDAIRTLAGTGHTGAVDELGRVLVDDGDAVVRARAAIGLGEHGTIRATRALVRALDDRSPLVRMQALRTLGRADPDGAVPELGAVLLGDPDPGVRRVAARTLGRLASPEAQRALEAAAGERDPLVRRAITGALARVLRNPR